MPQTECKVFDDNLEVSCTKLPVMRLLQLEARILRLVGPAFRDGFFSADLEGVAANFFTALGQMPPADMQALILEILAGCVATKDGRRVDLNSDTKINSVIDDLWQLHKVLWFSLEVNFKSFFDCALAAFQSKLAPAVAKVNP